MSTSPIILLGALLTLKSGVNILFILAGIVLSFGNIDKLGGFIV